MRTARTILCYTGPRSLARRARVGLGALGYDLVPVDARKEGAAASAAKVGDASLWIVDEGRLGELPSPESAPETPILLLTGSRPRDVWDPRVRAILKRPVGLVEAYRALQESLEATPRRSPRVPAKLAARVIWAGRPVVGAVLSISEWGCLFQTCADVGVDAALDFQLALPGSGLFTSRARCVHQRAGIGLEFGSAPSAMRDTIGDYVYHHLAAAAA